MSPVRSPRQKGEFALSARGSARGTRIPLATWIAFSGSSIAHVHVRPKMSSWRATKRSAEMRSR
jgi:hypothetical protein